MPTEIETEATPEITPNPTKQISLLAMAAIIIAIGAIIFSIQNFYSITQEKIRWQKIMVPFIKNPPQPIQKLPSLHNHFAPEHTVLENVAYLINLAQLQLTLAHDQTSALNTLLLARQQLLSSDNSSFSDLKQAISSDITTLQKIPTLHINALFSDIQDMIQKIQTLSPLPTRPTISLQSTVDHMKISDENLPWYRRALESLKQVKTLFVIRHLDHPSTPLIAPNLEVYLKQNIIAQLTFAQWALLHHDEKIYQSSLQTASQWLAQYFAISTVKNSIATQMDALEKIQMNPTLPTLENTLNALANIKNEPMPFSEKQNQKKSVPSKQNIPTPENNTTSVET